MLSLPAKTDLSRLFGSLAFRRNPQHLAIAGVSYCGSTLLANILGSLPEMANIGESHWLTARRQDGRTVPADIAGEDYGVQVHCRRCGEACTVLDRSFRMELQRDPSDWYEKIRKRLGGRMLVTSDKNLSKLERFDSELDMHLLILFKSPEQAAMSHLKHLARKTGRATTDEELVDYLDKWASAYRALLTCKNRGRKIGMSFEGFCCLPAKHIKELCRSIGTAYDQRAIDMVDEEQHSLGGNRRVAAALRDSYSIRIESPAVSGFDARQRQIIRDHSASVDVHRELTTLYRGSFPKSSSAKSAVESAEESRDVPLLPFVTKDTMTAIDEGISRLASERGFKLDKIAEKHRFYERLIHDQKSHLEARRAQLLKSDTPSKSALHVLDHVLRDVDFARYAAIQESFLQPDNIRDNISPLKYLDLDYWLDAKLRIISMLDIDRRRPSAILDIGCGCSHFGYICQLFGHQVLGTDIDMDRKGTQQRRDLFSTLSEFFGIERRLFRIEPYEALPDFGKRFDLVTALMAKFDFYEDNTSRWGEDEWTFFLTNLTSDVLKEDGELFMGLNTAKGVDHILSYMERLGADVNRNGAFVHFSDLPRLRRSLKA